MHYVIISDLHLGKRFYDYSINPYYEDQTDVNIQWAFFTQQYVLDIVEKQSHLRGERVIFVFLGDSIDFPQQSIPGVPFLDVIFERILSLSDKWEIILQIGNHDSSRFPSTCKSTALSEFFNYDNKLTVVNSPSIAEYTYGTVIHFPYVKFSSLLPTLYMLQKHSVGKRVFLFSHNYIYVADSFKETATIPIDNVREILRCSSLMVFNGHLHTTYYETNYFQLGSVSPTSFKESPFASGICYYNIETDKYDIYKNLRILFFSIATPTFLEKLKEWLDQCRVYNSKVFLQYSNSTQQQVDSLSSLYKDVIVGVRFKDVSLKHH